MSVPAEQLAELIGAGVSEAVEAMLPERVDRHMTQLQRELGRTVESAIARVPAGRDGRDGLDGRFAPPVDWQADKTFPASTIATHNGATWFALRRTDREPGTDNSGWTELTRGLTDITLDYDPVLEPRRAAVVLRLSDGQDVRRELRVRAVVHRGKFDPERDYELDDETAWNGATWRLNVGGAKGLEPGTADCWTLVSKQGGRGKTGERGQDGDVGKLGPEGPAGARGPRGERGLQGVPGLNGQGLNYRGTFEFGETYERGDIVLHASANWHCNETVRDVVPQHDRPQWTLYTPPPQPVNVGGGRGGGAATPSTPTVTVTSAGDLPGVAAGPNNSFVILDDGVNPKRTFERVEGELVELGGTGVAAGTATDERLTLAANIVNTTGDLPALANAPLAGAAVWLTINDSFYGVRPVAHRGISIAGATITLDTTPAGLGFPVETTDDIVAYYTS